MKYPERNKIAGGLSYEAKLGFVAFCVERCLKEARRHPAAKEQLDRLPLLTEGLEMLWASAEHKGVPDPERVSAVRAHLLTYQRPAADQENMMYNYDVTMVDAASTLITGMRLLQNQDVDAEEVAAALEGPVQSMGGIYADYRKARDAEVKVIDTALARLRDQGSKPFSRAIFENIPEWKRGEVAEKYAAGRLTGTDIHQEDE